MTPKIAERLIRRRARALAEVRRPDSTEPITVAINVFAAAPWQARVAAKVGGESVVIVESPGDDPNAALLALPEELARLIEATRAKLAESLSVHVDGEELLGAEEPSQVLALTSPTPRRRRAKAPETPESPSGDGDAT